MPARRGSVAIATALYPQPPLIAQQFAEGVRAVAEVEGHVTLVSAVESGTDTTDFLPHDLDDVTVVRRDAPEGIRGASLRQLMLDAAIGSDAEIILFADCDDRLNAQAGERHRDALSEADMSYGDMDLMDAAGDALPGSLYGSSKVPATLSGGEALTWFNLFGLSNSAVRRSALANLKPVIPSGITAVDWFLATTLLESGAKASLAEGPVGLYRQHAGNTLGAASALSAKALLGKATVARQHFGVLRPTAQRKEALRLIEGLCKVLTAANETELNCVVNAECGPLWYEDVFAAARLAAAEREF